MSTPTRRSTTEIGLDLGAGLLQTAEPADYGMALLRVAEQRDLRGW
jgi:hypothetical protein